MKRHILHCVVLCAALTAMPMIPAFLITPRSRAAAPELSFPELVEFTDFPTDPTTAADTAEPETAAGTGYPAAEVYRVLKTDSGEVLEVPVTEYLIGAVAAEMPVSFEPEALEAQVVAAHTYAERQCLITRERGGSDADFSDDPAKYQAYLTDAELRERWGSQYEENYKKIAAAVEAAAGELLYYEEEPIIAAFHAISGGKTETAANVWGSDVAYLQSVESDADREAPDYEETVTFSAEEVMTRLTAAHAGLTVSGDAAGWFGTPTVSEAGTVLQIPAGDGIFTGQELRSIFSLRSADFTVNFADGEFCFTTHGYGHAVGMSQYGANAMAKNGADHREILAHYYPGAKLM